MSIEAMQYVRRLQLGLPARKLVLLSLADRADEAFSCYPAVSLLAAECELKPRQVQNHLRWFREHGLVSDREQFRPDGSQTSNRYFLHGPWDSYGGSGGPFAEITYPRLQIVDGSFRAGTRGAKGMHSSAPLGVHSAAPPPRTRVQGGGAADDTGVVQPDAPAGAHPAAPLEPSVEPSLETSDDPAPSARSAADGRRPSTGRARASVAGGSAASGKTKPRPDERERLTRRQAAEVVDQAVPAVLLEAVSDRRPLINVAAVAIDEGRTPEQIVRRAERRWNLHEYASKWYAGEIESPTGVAIALLRPGACPDPRCDDGTNVDTGQACPRCIEREADFRRDRRQSAAAKVPAARIADTLRSSTGYGRVVMPIAEWPECVDCGGWVRQPSAAGRCAECEEALTALGSLLGPDAISA